MPEHAGKKADGRVGMWLFIATEILLFGGLFLLYSMYRFKNAADFHNGSLELSRFAGTLNTCILLTSSLFIALSIYLHERKRDKSAGLLLLLTIAMAFGFLVVKAFEWGEKFEHGLYPGAARLLTLPKGEMLYFGLYFMMTGLHALHVIVGIGVLTTMYIFLRRGSLMKISPVMLENSGLYWHLVDIIWIFLFPLFYLIA
jgi:cytochrome c oxidase subunit 3